MNRLEPIKTLGYSLDIDFENESFSVVMEKLTNSGMCTFWLNFKPDVTLCMISGAEACKEMRSALDRYLNTLENRKIS